MHTCIPLHRLKRSWHSCPRWVNASNESTPSLHIHEDGMRLPLWVDEKNAYTKVPPKKVNPRDIAGNTEKEEEAVQCQDSVFKAWYVRQYWVVRVNKLHHDFIFHFQMRNLQSQCLRRRTWTGKKICKCIQNFWIGRWDFLYVYYGVYMALLLHLTRQAKMIWLCTRWQLSFQNFKSLICNTYLSCLKLHGVMKNLTSIVFCLSTAKRRNMKNVIYEFTKVL